MTTPRLQSLFPRDISYFTSQTHGRYEEIGASGHSNLITRKIPARSCKVAERTQWFWRANRRQNAVSTQFTGRAARKFDNVVLFVDVSELPEIVRSINASWPAVASSAGSRKAVDEFGWNACCQRYAQLFETVAGHPAGVAKPVIES